MKYIPSFDLGALLTVFKWYFLQEIRVYWSMLKKQKTLRGFVACLLDEWIALVHNGKVSFPKDHSNFHAPAFSRDIWAMICLLVSTLHCKCFVCWIHRWMSANQIRKTTSSNFNRSESLTKVFCFHAIFKIWKVLI